MTTFVFRRKTKLDMTSKWSSCIVKSNKKKNILEIQNNACDLIRRHFGDGVAIIGTPGSGKSTLASTIYNVMRGTEDEYFSISKEVMNNYTRGIWTLNEDTKTLASDKDKIDIIDCEGLDDKDVIHYLVVVALVLSKAIIIPSRDGRFAFRIFNTIEAGLKLFEKYQLQLPKPVIFIQAPYNDEFVTVTTDDDEKIEFDVDQLPNFCRTEFPFFEPIKIETFTLPSFKTSNNGRFDTNYTKSVKNLIERLKNIKCDEIRIQTRWDYVETVVKALNTNSPTMILNLNMKFYKNELDLRVEEIKSQTLVVLQEEYNNIRLIKKQSIDEFINLHPKCKNGKYYFYDDILKTCKNLPFYDAKNKGINNIINDINTNKFNYFIDPKNYVKQIYQQQLEKLKNRLLVKCDKQMEKDNRDFETYVTNLLKTEINKIKFYGDTSLSYNIKSQISTKKNELKRKLLKKAENTVELPLNEYLDYDIDKQWDILVMSLKSQWQSQISAAKSSRYYVKTCGDTTCPKCETKHEKGVGHKSCGNDKALWMWVDSKTNYCVCDSCGELSTITGVCCWTCNNVSLPAKIIVTNYP